MMQKKTVPKKSIKHLNLKVGSYYGFSKINVPKNPKYERKARALKILTNADHRMLGRRSDTDGDETIVFLGGAEIVPLNLRRSCGWIIHRIKTGACCENVMRRVWGGNIYTNAFASTYWAERTSWVLTFFR